MVNFLSGDFDSLSNQRKNKFACCFCFVVELPTPYKLFHQEICEHFFELNYFSLYSTLEYFHCYKFFVFIILTKHTVMTYLVKEKI